MIDFSKIKKKNKKSNPNYDKKYINTLHLIIII